MAPLRSRSSGSSTSSLSSTFSDITSSTSTSFPSPPKPKTDAFFASPFSTRSPSPEFRAPSPSILPSSHQSTLSAFSTPIRSTSPPLSSKTSKSLLFPRVFPSKYASSMRKSPELHLDQTDRFSFLSDSDPSFSSTLDNSRLPTPPLVSPMQFNWDNEAPPSSSETVDLSTPRPPHLLPFHGLLLANQKIPDIDHHDELSNPDSTDNLEPGSILTIPWSSVAPSALPSPVSIPLTIASSTTDLDSSHERGCGDHRSPTPKAGVISSPSKSTADRISTLNSHQDAQPH